MTDREVADINLAETWVGENGFGSDCNNINSVKANGEMVNAFLAGLKVERSEELEKPYDYRSVVYAIEHILLGYKNDISPNLRAKLNHWKNNIQEELDKEEANDR